MTPLVRISSIFKIQFSCLLSLFHEWFFNGRQRRTWEWCASAQVLLIRVEKRFLFKIQFLSIEDGGWEICNIDLKNFLGEIKSFRTSCPATKISLFPGLYARSSWNMNILLMRLTNLSLHQSSQQIEMNCFHHWFPDRYSFSLTPITYACKIRGHIHRVRHTSPTKTQRKYKPKLYRSRDLSYQIHYV